MADMAKSRERTGVNREYRMIGRIMLRLNGSSYRKALELVRSDRWQYGAEEERREIATIIVQEATEDSKEWFRKYDVFKEEKTNAKQDRP